MLGELAQVAAIGAEVVVDDVEDDAKAEGMGAVHEAAEVVGRAVQPGRGEQVHAVVAPAEAAGEVGDRHHFHDGNTQLGQRRQLAGGRLPRPFRREGADVHLVNDLPLAADARPARVGPAEAAGVDHLGRPVRAVRLKARRRVGEGPAVAVEPVAVEAAVARSRDQSREVAVAFRLQFRHPRGLTFEDHLDALPPGRPDAEVDAATRLHLRPDW